jgi:mono/diheme cytochrome c family protein
MAQMNMLMRLVIIILGCAVGNALAQNVRYDTEFPSTYMPSGRVLYNQYCASCHGADGKGKGPAASNLKTPPADLTKLTERHMGRFPYEYVSNVLRFGPGLIVGSPGYQSSTHGSSDMPMWGGIFMAINKNEERAVQQRIKNLCDYLASVQEK